MTETVAIASDPTINDSLRKMEAIYIENFTELVLPILSKSLNFTPKGVVTAKASLNTDGVTSNISFVIGFDFTDKYPDPFELVNQILFMEFFNRAVQTFGTNK